MVVAISIILSLFCLIVIAFPILKSRHARQVVNPLETIDELVRERRLFYQELLMLEESFRVGNVPRAEFESLSRNLKWRASENLYVQGRWEKQLEKLDEALERQVLKLRNIHRNGQNTVICPECEIAAPVSQANCNSCGAVLHAPAGSLTSESKDR